MDALFGLSVLAGIIGILALLGIGAAVAGVDSRPGFCEDKSHHSSFWSEI
jgi:hypothetical protein